VPSGPLVDAPATVPPGRHRPTADPDRRRRGARGAGSPPRPPHPLRCWGRAPHPGADHAATAEPRPTRLASPWLPLRGPARGLGVGRGTAYFTGGNPTGAAIPPPAS